MTLRPMRRAPLDAATTWGPYYEALNPPCLVHTMVNWKVVPKEFERAERLWQQRQEKRRAYETVYGPYLEMWPTQHPGIVLGANGACQGCNWFHVGGRHRRDGVYEQHWKLARRHETSNGAFSGGNDEMPSEMDPRKTAPGEA
jgi:hypothetical protein